MLRHSSGLIPGLGVISTYCQRHNSNCTPIDANFFLKNHTSLHLHCNVAKKKNCNNVKLHRHRFLILDFCVCDVSSLENLWKADLCRIYYMAVNWIFSTIQLFNSVNYCRPINSIFLVPAWHLWGSFDGFYTDYYISEKPQPVPLTTRDIIYNLFSGLHTIGLLSYSIILNGVSETVN